MWEFHKAVILSERRHAPPQASESKDFQAGLCQRALGLLTPNGRPSGTWPVANLIPSAEALG